MSRYIDADALMDALNVFKDRKNGNEHFMYGIETAKELLGIQPTVDAVPVVRCGECKYDGRCMFQSFVIDNSRDEVPYDKNTFYCADGERKDGEG